MTTDKLERDIQRGDRAKRILADELVSEANKHIEAELWRLFKDTSPADLDALKHIKGMQYFHAKYFAFFESAVTNGKLAAINLEAKKKTLRERIFS